MLQDIRDVPYFSN